MEINEIKWRIESIDKKYKKIFPDEVICKTDVRFDSYASVCPDNGLRRNLISVDNYFFPDSSFWGDDSEISFRMRIEDPAIFVYSVFLERNYRGRGLGYKFVDMIEDISKSFNCEMGPYIESVTNPSFWRHMGYFPYTKSRDGVCWAKMTSRAKDGQLSLNFGNDSFD